MQIYYKKANLIVHLNSIKTPQSTLGFVPTMGALHQGHLSLMQESMANNETTVVSIFVNPTQFNNPDDLKKYPKTLEQDIEKIKTLNPNLIVYAPSIEDIYQGNTTAEPFDFDGLEHQMEGQFRPGHFDGVGTVVKKLFEIVAPTNAYFGEKDFQQLQIIKKMTAKNNLNITIVGCPIYREENQLAMSSRNERLTKTEKQEAGFIYQTICKAKEKFKQNSAQEVIKWVTTEFEKKPIFELEYFQIANEATLLPCNRKNKKHHYRGFIAVIINNIRLIDTISFK